MNRRWLNVVAVFIVAVLLLLSGILMATTLLPDLDVFAVTEYLAATIVVLAVLTVGVLK